MARYVNPSCFGIQAPITFVVNCITDEDARNASKIQFVIRIRAEPRVTSTTENFEKVIIRCTIEKLLKWTDVGDGFGRHSVDKVDSSLGNLSPKVKWK
jgi:hypothetical protein